MNIVVTEPPRVFLVGRGEKIPMKDCGRISLEPDEQVSFTTPSGAEYDVSRKSWGFYATPSLNHRLMRFGFRAVLIKNVDARFFVLLVERGHEGEFERYIQTGGHTIVTWLDDTPTLLRIEQVTKLPVLDADRPCEEPGT